MDVSSKSHTDHQPQSILSACVILGPSGSGMTWEAGQTSSLQLTSLFFQHHDLNMQTVQNFSCLIICLDNCSRDLRCLLWCQCVCVYYAHNSGKIKKSFRVRIFFTSQGTEIRLLPKCIAFTKVKNKGDRITTG